MNEKTLQKIEAKIIVSDRNRHGCRLWCEHGLSILINCHYEDDSVCLLFDTAASPGLLTHNLQKLKVTPSDIDTVFLSHCHHDHTGGLEALLDEDADFDVIGHPELTRQAVSTRGKLQSVGIRKEIWNELKQDNVFMLAEPVEIHPDVWVSGSIKRNTDFEKPRENMYTIRDGHMKVDHDPDDMAIWFDMGTQGLALFTGCGHSGIANTVIHAANVAQTNKFKAVIGGFHLINANEQKVRQTAEVLSEYEIEEFRPGHCTGREAEDIFSEYFDERNQPFSTGDEMIYER